MGMNTEDWVGVMGSIGKILEHKRLERKEEANQPLVQIWDDKTNSKIYVPRNEAVGKSTTQNEVEKWQNDATSSLKMFKAIYTGVDLSEAENFIGKIETQNDYDIFQDYLETKDPNRGLTDAQKKSLDVDLFEFRRVNSILTSSTDLSVDPQGGIIASKMNLTKDMITEYEAKRNKLQARLFELYGIDMDYVNTTGGPGTATTTSPTKPKAY